jgi:hypothetical protein
MILVDGTMLASEEISTILPSLERRVCRTLQKPLLNPMIVVEACHRLAQKIEQGNYFPLLSQLIKDGSLSRGQIDQVIHLFHRESLLYKLKLELGDNLDWPMPTPPFYEASPIHRKRMPLGVLFHIAAGNVDGLPAFSVVEGLLSGNINVLKLPSADKDFTIQLLSELIKLEPILAEYIYVFDTPSTDIASMKAMAKCADGIVVWGGDDAVEAVRKTASPNTKIIEWGHKLSFAYVTEDGMSDMALAGLAHHILNTKQLLCSSCQGIYIDTADMQVVYQFCERFLAILERVARDYPQPGIGIKAQIILLLHNQKLEAVSTGSRIFRGNRCSITAMNDRRLEVSYTYGNCWVKALQRQHIINRLHRYKGYLQTVGLLCGDYEKKELTELLSRAGATRITDGSEMSRMVCGEAHDGDYPLRRYSRIVEYNE